MNKREFKTNSEGISLVDDSGIEAIERLIRSKRLTKALMDTPVELGEFKRDFIGNKRDIVFTAHSDFLLKYNQKARGSKDASAMQYVLFPDLFGGQNLYPTLPTPATYMIRVSLEQRAIDLTVDSNMLPEDVYDRKLDEADLSRLDEDLQTLKSAHLRLDDILAEYAHKNGFSYSSPFRYNK